MRSIVRGQAARLGRRVRQRHLLRERRSEVRAHSGIRECTQVMPSSTANIITIANDLTVT